MWRLSANNASSKSWQFRRTERAPLVPVETATLSTAINLVHTIFELQFFWGDATNNLDQAICESRLYTVGFKII